MPRSMRGLTESPVWCTSTAFPLAMVQVINDEFPTENGEMPLPDWSRFEGARPH